MAKRDKRRVFSRLVVLMTHILKWDHQPDRRSNSWRGSINVQQRELRSVLRSRTLLNHAGAVFVNAYNDARGQSADETGLPIATLPASALWTIVEILTWEPDAE